MADARWKDGCKGMLTVTSIFAGVSGVIVVNILMRSDTLVRDWRFYLGVSAALFALFLFVWVAERLSDALDEGRPGTYVKAMYRFNFAVLGAFVAISAFVSWLDTRSILDKGFPHITFGDVAAIGVLFATFTWGPWLRDAMFLYDRLSVGIDADDQLVQIDKDSAWNDWRESLLAKD